MSLSIPGSSIPSIRPVEGGASPVGNPGSSEGGFAGMMGEAIDKANESQLKADQAIQGFMKGDQTEIHQVMLAMEQARLSMMMAVEVRNKSLEAYQEISRMPL
jgi:flagellar hook-basal body complex protein FliE